GIGAEVGATVTVWDGATSVGSGVVDPLGNWTANVILPASDGPHSLTASQTDAAGNTGATSGPVTYVLDTMPPAPPVITSTGALTNDPALLVSGIGAEVGATVTVWDGVTSVGSGVVDPFGNWTANVILPAGDGPHSLTAGRAA